MRRAFFVLIIGALCFIAYYLAAGNRAESVRTGETNKAAVAGTVPDISVPRPVSATPSATVPLAPLAPPPAAMRSAPPALTLNDIRQPAVGTPVKDLLTTLREAADQGIPQAACRLGIELIKCARLRDTLVRLGEAQAEAAKAPKNSGEATRLMRWATEISQNLGDDNRMCNGVPQEVARDAWRYINAAAAAGSVAAMSRFVRDPGLALSDPDAADGWSAYRSNAPGFLTSAINGGDVRALYQAWFSAFSGQSTGGSGIFARDPDKALQYGTSLTSLLDPVRASKVSAANERLAQELGADRAQAARLEGEKLRNARFANAKPPIWTPDDGITEIADCWK